MHRTSDPFLTASSLSIQEQIAAYTVNPSVRPLQRAAHASATTASPFRPLPEPGPKRREVGASLGRIKQSGVYPILEHEIRVDFSYRFFDTRHPVIGDQHDVSLNGLGYQPKVVLVEAKRAGCNGIIQLLRMFLVGPSARL